MAKLIVKVSPNAKRTEVSNLNPLRIRLAAAPLDGKANEELINFLAEQCGIARSCVAILHGASSKTKILEVEGLTLEEISHKLAKNSQQALL